MTGGIYFGESGIRETDNGPAAYDIETYSEMEVRRIAKIGFEMAMKRRKHLTSVDKSNVLESSRLWRRVVNEVAQDYPEVQVEHMYVTMQPCRSSGTRGSLMSSLPPTSLVTSIR